MGPKNARVGVPVRSTDQAPDVVLRAVDAGLDAHNYAAAPCLADVRPLASYATDANGTVLGGAVGRTWGVCCELLELWVDQTQRGQGLGSALLDAFEVDARQRACQVFYLTTLSFQAPAFYAKRGYRVLAQIDGYPQGIVKYLMHKDERSGGEA